MNDTLYDKVKEKVNQYNTLLTEYGVKITLQHRSYKEEVEAYNHYGIGCNNLWNLLEYILFKKGIEEKKYHHTPNQYKLLVLAVEPTKKSKANKKDYKKYAFLVYSMSRGFQGEKPIEYQSKEQKTIKKIEKRLEKLLKKAERKKSSDWCCNNLKDSFRYSFATKYGYIENYCGKSRFFWEVLWMCIFAVPFLLFALCGLISSLIH